MVDLILHGGRITSLDPKQPEISVVAITDGCIVASGDVALCSDNGHSKQQVSGGAR